MARDAGGGGGGAGGGACMRLLAAVIFSPTLSFGFVFSCILFHFTGASGVSEGGDVENDLKCAGFPPANAMSPPTNDRCLGRCPGRHPQNRPLE